MENIFIAAIFLVCTFEILKKIKILSTLKELFQDLNIIKEMMITIDTIDNKLQKKFYIKVFNIFKKSFIILLIILIFFFFIEFIIKKLFYNFYYFIFSIEGAVCSIIIWTIYSKIRNDKL